MDQFDCVIIGSGQAAAALAVGLAKRGQSVALVEADRLGELVSIPAARRPKLCANRRAWRIWRGGLLISA